MGQTIAFLFGSGISLPAKLPSTQDITERVLTGKGVARHSDETYYFGKPMNGMPDEYIPKVVSFIRRLKMEIDNYYAFNQNRQTNYEDIYSLASQIHDSESNEYDNPAISALINKIRSDSWHILVGRPNLKWADWRIIDISTEATNYIADVLWHLLTIPPSDLSYLSFIDDCQRDSRFDQIDIFTLNHDTVLETYFENLNMPSPLIDGFDVPTNNVRYWNPSLFESSNNNRIRLFKLHGSINWFRFEDKPSLTLGIPLKEFWNSPSIDYPPKGRPEILIGTLNKIFLYAGPIYIDLHSLFYRSLRNIRKLIISGYGFNDKIINTRVIYWLSSHPENKMILIHPDLKQLKSTARLAVARQLEYWINENKCSLIEKRIELTNWTDIQGVIS